MTTAAEVSPASLRGHGDAHGGGGGARDFRRRSRPLSHDPLPDRASGGHRGKRHRRRHARRAPPTRISALLPPGPGGGDRHAYRPGSGGQHPGRGPRCSGGGDPRLARRPAHQKPRRRPGRRGAPPHRAHLLGAGDDRRGVHPERAPPRDRARPVSRLAGRSLPRGDARRSSGFAPPHRVRLRPGSRAVGASAPCAYGPRLRLALVERWPAPGDDAGVGGADRARADVCGSRRGARVHAPSLHAAPIGRRPGPRLGRSRDAPRVLPLLDRSPISRTHVFTRRRRTLRRI